MTLAYYFVAYPHPSVARLRRCLMWEVGPDTHLRDLINCLCERYPDYVRDLERATFWKVSDLFVINRCPLSTRFQASGDLSKADVCGHSTQKVSNWISRQDNEAEIPWSRFIVQLFPDGPHDRSLGKVDIVVVTPESASSRPNPNYST